MRAVNTDVCCPYIPGHCTIDTVSASWFDIEKIAFAHDFLLSFVITISVFELLST